MAHVRLARFHEQAQMAHVFALAFSGTELFGELIHPHHKEFPADSDLYWLRRCQVDWWDYRHRFVVTTTRNKNARGGEGEVVTGVAHWERLGEGGRQMECWWWDPRNLAKPFAKFYTRVTARLYPNRAADPVKEDIIERSHHFLDDVWTGSRAECWLLNVLAVHPDYQRRGLGIALVQWGLDQAEREAVCASVISADGKERFYGRCGFDAQEGRAGMGEGNPLADVPGGLIFFRDARD